jgi:hypothetical protein
MVFALNPRRKRRGKGRKSRRRSYNRRRTRRTRRVRFNYRRSRRRARNGVSAALGGVTSGFNLNLLKNGALVVAGAVGNNFLTKQLVNIVPVSFLKTAPGNYVTGLLASGILGMVAKLVTPSYAPVFFFGGVLDVVMRATNQYLLPVLRLSPLKGLADYLTVSGAASARPLADLGDDDDGMGSYLTVADAQSARPLAGMGDYLEVRDIPRLLPLNGMGQEAEGEELASM